MRTTLISKKNSKGMMDTNDGAITLLMNTMVANEEAAMVVESVAQTPTNKTKLKVDSIESQKQQGGMFPWQYYQTTRKLDHL